MPRKPDPFLPFYLPAFIRRPGAATYEGKPVDVKKAFREWGWDQIAKILVDDDGNLHYPWREKDPLEHVPYKGEGMGYMSREELEETEYTDADLERLARQLFDIPLDLSGEDTPEKRFLRYSAYDRIVAAETGQIVP